MSEARGSGLEARGSKLSQSAWRRSVFSLIKRGVMSTFHSVTRKHLPNYLNEFEFRYNTRKLITGSAL